MEIGDLRALATVLCTVGFLSVAFWAYSGRRKEQFREASLLPFADDDDPKSAQENTIERMP